MNNKHHIQKNIKKEIIQERRIRLYKINRNLSVNLSLIKKDIKTLNKKMFLM